jgi:hypothetical protein
MSLITTREVPPGTTPLFVITGDVHIHQHQYANHMTEYGWPNRVLQGIRVLELCYKTAVEYAVPFIINGDLTHNKNSMDPVVTDALVSFFQTLDEVPVHLIAGNHEKPEKFQHLSTLSAFAKNRVSVIDKPELREYSGYKAVLCPFAYAHKSQIAAAEVHGTAHLFIGHFPTHGVNLGKHVLESSIRFEDFHPDRYLALLFNDIHKHQSVGTNGYHLGAPMQNNFGEADYECGWWLVSARGADIFLTFFPSKAPTFHYVETEEAAEQIRAAGNYARIRPQAVVKKIMAEQDKARLDFDTNDLDTTIKNYVDFQVNNGKFSADDKDAILKAAKEIL